MRSGGDPTYRAGFTARISPPTTGAGACRTGGAGVWAALVFLPAGVNPPRDSPVAPPPFRAPFSGSVRFVTGVSTFRTTSTQNPGQAGWTPPVFRPPPG